ncbi:MAG: PAS domain S-box protein, partial [Chloroflexi bacterium]|nr:PAS domain S-box protein [Chloroflexota bacterium]
MAKKKDKARAEELRKRAEKMLTEDPQAIRTMVPADIQKLIQELNVYQIELELQNEELRRTQLELQEARDKYLNLYDFAPAGYFTLDRNGIIVDVNLAGSELLGSEKHRLIGTQFTSSISPDSQDAFYFHYRESLKTGTKSSCELKMLKADGTLFPAQLISMAMPEKDGNINQCRTAVMDITERKRAEETLREAKEFSQSLITSARDGVSVLDNRGVHIDVNPALCEMTGFLREELIGAGPPHPYWPPEQYEEIDRAFRNTLAGDFADVELTFMRKNGQRFPVIVSPAGIKDKEGNVISYFALVKDITERKLAEEMLRQSEEKYRTILAEIADSYFEVDLTGNLTFVNDSTCRNLSYSREELLGMNYRGFTAEEDIKHVFQIFNDVYRTGEPNIGFPWKIIRKDGNVGFVEASVSLLHSQTGEIIGFRGVGRDITERKKAEEERKQLELKAQVTSRLASVGEMAAGVAHEINNPLTGVIGYAQLLMDRKDVPPDIRKDLVAMNEGAQRVAGIVKRLLTFSRQTKPERRYVDINELIESTLALRAYHLRVNNIKVTTQLAPDLLETVADPGQIQQVLLNLIVNAETEMKLAHGKGKLAITTEKSDNTIKICCQDNGPGIKPEIIDRIFDPFFTTREVGQGTGLGLSLCYGIITEHKGKIYAESKPGKGATFTVELPVVAEAEPPKPSEAVVEEPEKVAKARILVVDDEQVIRDFVKRVLAGEGYEVETVDNAGDALKKIEGKRYNLVLIDIKMPAMDGVELYRRIQKIAKSLARRVVFITGDIMGA